MILFTFFIWSAQRCTLLTYAPTTLTYVPTTALLMTTIHLQWENTELPPARDTEQVGTLPGVGKIPFWREVGQKEMNFGVRPHL